MEQHACRKAQALAARQRLHHQTPPQANHHQNHRLNPAHITAVTVLPSPLLAPSPLPKPTPSTTALG
eukprot:4359702-Pleurochrysis_carterae.AAC.1